MKSLQRLIETRYRHGNGTIAFVTSWRIDWYARWPVSVNLGHHVTLTRDQILKVDLSRANYTSVDAPEQEKYDGVKMNFLSFLNETLLKKNIFKNTIIFTLMASGVYTIDLTSSLTKNVTWALPWLSNVLCRYVLSIMVFEILMIIWRNTRILGKSSGNLNFDFGKKWRK